MKRICQNISALWLSRILKRALKENLAKCLSARLAGHIKGAIGDFFTSTNNLEKYV